MSGDLTSRIGTSGSKNLKTIRSNLNIISENYQQSVLGDINSYSVVNIQDVILLVNMILGNQTDSIADINSDGTVNVLDIIQLVNIILS